MTAQIGPSLSGAAAAIGRGFALFLGGFTLLNLVRGAFNHHLDANLWWVDLRAFPTPVSYLLLAIAGLALLAHGAGLRARWLRAAALLGIICLIAIALGNAAGYYHLRSSARIHGGSPLAFSLLLAAVLAVAAFSAAAPGPTGSRLHEKALVGLGLAACLVGFPLGQIFCFGSTDYRRQADVIVVFGARAYASGQPSTALADRVRTACMLYRDGMAPRLIFSGGPGDGPVHETEAMRRMAVGLGVPNSAILIDQRGFNTHATVRNTCALFTRMRLRRVMVVSHSFHLPRIKMSYQQAGWEVYTVPCYKPMLRAEVPVLVLRETAALWVYYLTGR